MTSCASSSEPILLGGMADAFTELQAQDSAADPGHAEWLGLLIDRGEPGKKTIL